MRNYEVDNMLPTAINLIDVHIKKSSPHIDEAYESATSAFGGTLIQCGALPALALYLKTSRQSELDKPRIAYCLLALVKFAGGFGNLSLTDLQANENTKDKAKKWMEEAIDAYTSANTHSHFEIHLRNAVIALKLALRTFDLK